MILAYLHVGGLVAIGFDATGRYILTVSHSGRGVFDTQTWKRVARDSAEAYPDEGVATGIGPIDGQNINVVEIDYESETLDVPSPNGAFTLSYESGMITVNSAGNL